MQTWLSVGAGDFLDRHDVAGRRRLRHERDELGEVDVLLLVEIAGVAGRELHELVRALLLGHPPVRLVVGWEHRAGRSELGDHVRDRPALGVAEARDARAGELEDRAAAAAHAAPAQELENHVLRLDPGPLKLVLEEDADDLRARQLEGVAGHADGHVEPAGADCDHRARARLRRVAVGPDEGLARRGEALAVDVVADPVAGP